MKNTTNTLIGIYKTLTQIDISKVNTKTAYWIGRNARKLEPYVKTFEELQDKIRKDAWFESFSKSVEVDGEESARKEYAVQLSEADKEVKEHLEQEVEITFYTIKLDDLELEGKYIPMLLDLITEV